MGAIKWVELAACKADGSNTYKSLILACKARADFGDLTFMQSRVKGKECKAGQVDSYRETNSVIVVTWWWK